MINEEGNSWSARLRWLLLLTAIVAASVVVLVATSPRTEAQDQGNRPAAQSPTGGNVSSGDISVAERTDAREYWTPQRMRNAKELDITVPGPPSAPESGALPQPEGPSVKVPPVAPGGNSTTGASSSVVQPAATTSEGYSYPFPFTRYEVFDPGVSNYTAYPYRTHGKVLFTKATGGDFVCSGTVVNAENRSTVWTAGHCVSDGAGRFHRNWVFVPAYRDNVRPFGTWAARELQTRAEWHNFGNFEQDVAAAIVNPLNGVSLQNRVGAQGIIFNQPYPQHWHSFGYPQDAPFNGNRQFACAASFAKLDNANPRPSPLAIGIGCDMTGGASGGGWILGFKGSGGFVNSVNSYKYFNPSQPLAMYGPYHGNEALSLFNFVRTR